MTSSDVIRDYRPDDLDAVVALVRELQEADHTRFDRMKPTEAIGPWYVEALLQECAKTDGSLLVAERAGRVIGYASLFARVEQDDIDEITYTYAYVGDLAVTGDARGQGVGQRLLSACEALARSRGTRWLRISALAKNARARRIYQEFGFAEHLVTLEKPLD